MREFVAVRARRFARAAFARKGVKMGAVIAAIVLLAGAVCVAMIYAVGFALAGFFMLGAAIFHYGGAFWGFAWIGFWVLVVAANALVRKGENSETRG